MSGKSTLHLTLKCHSVSAIFEEFGLVTDDR